MAQEDRAWEEVQIKAFTFWANGHMPADSPIVDLQKDFGDGLKLIALAESLTKCKLGAKYKKKPKNRVHYIENIHLALMHLGKASAVKVASYGTEDFADGKIKPILGFLWTLLRHFRVVVVHGSEDKPFEDSLLSWIKETISEYEVPVNDFVDSFSDGRALLALLHKYDNTFVAWDAVNGSHKTENCTQAFSTAEAKINIPQLMDPAKLAEGATDDKSMVLYLSLLQQAFVRKFADAAANLEKTGITSKLTAVQESLAAITTERDELLTTKTNLEAEIARLTGSNDEWKGKCKVLEEENSQLKKDLANQTKRTSQLEEKIRVMEELMASEAAERAELQGEITRLKELVEKLKREKKDVEDERDDLKAQRDALEQEQRQMMDSMDAFKAARTNLEAGYDKRNKLGLLGLDVLRKNLLEHLNDMNIWKNHLEQDRNYQSETVQVTTESSISSFPFEDQLESLSTALATENTKLQLLLKDREREEAEKKAAKENNSS